MKKYLLIVFNVLVLNSQNLKKLDYYSNKFFDSNDDQEKLYCANSFINLAKKENKKIYFAIGYYLFVNFYYETNPKKALYYYDKVIENSKYQSHPAFPMIAYCEKAELLQQENRIDESMKTYHEALAYCREINNDYENVIELSIAIVKSEELGETEEALKTYKKCYKILKQNKNFSYYYLKSIFSIADAYKTLKYSDSATYYNNLGYKEAFKFKNNSYVALFVLNEGANLVTKKRYKLALDSINKIKTEVFNLLGNTLNPLACHYYSGLAYQGLGKNDKALVEFKKVDSFYQIKKRITPEFVKGYVFIINYYHRKGDLKNELKYLKKYNSIELGFIKKYKKLYINIKEKYEIPELIHVKENENYILKKFLFLIFSILFLAFLYIVFIKIKMSRNKKLFDAILNNKTLITNISLNENSNNLQDQKLSFNNVFKENRLKSNDINPKIIESILQRLVDFEENKSFLKKSITSQSLAIDFDTNSKYISNVINDYKKCKVNEYINNLRIEYAIVILQKDKKMRRYNLEALAFEFGYNNVESFNAAFLKKTGIKTSYYIKELEKNLIHK